MLWLYSKIAGLRIRVMKKILGNKYFILTLGVICVLALIILAAGISSLEFKPGIPFAYVADNQGSSPGEMPDFNPLMCFVPVLLALVVVYLLLPKDQRKKYLWALAQLVLAGIIIFIIISRMALGTAVPQPTRGRGRSLRPWPRLRRPRNRP